MDKRISMFLFIVLATLISGCSQDKKDVIQGSWVANQADQIVGTEEELTLYNFIEFSENEVTFRNFVYEIENEKTVRKFSETNIKADYELNKENKITINDEVYEIELKKTEMTLKNENIEIHYIKEE
ncbi:hypothetical protein RB620_30040 [Paenibacillus sp. LHD-117]|uniref:hypothetical protein n=1 Tax=Paenibacillus sp. LHD-117 TaxID=3071412 RepID=UPI0027DEFE9B|nr:hypothetical protein [Paenibacillus sp. LHD-117]MDQ6423656.1 hypothetical protein [Paenibacillus sp. LHD-117]